MFTRTHRPTLVDLIRPQTLGAWWNVLLVIAFGALMGLTAQISIALPGRLVPITGQTFGVLLAAMLLGGWRGAAAMLVYLAEALAGLPVLAGGTSAWTPSSAGVPVIVGPTAGYLFAFPVAAFVVGWLAERGWDRNVALAVAAMLAGEAVIYLGGVSWLLHFVGNDVKLALDFGFYPFLLGDAIKLGLVTVALPTAWRLLRGATHRP